MVVLLTGADEYPFLSEWLRAEAQELQTIHVTNLGEIEALPEALLPEARLVAFCTGVIVPGRILHSLGHGAYNFHPGPPSYPGSAPATFAIYEQSPTFGVTAHEMRKRVDCGPIVGCDIFPVPPEIAVRDLEEMAYAALAKLFRSCAAMLVQPEPPPHLPLAWSSRKSTRRAFAQLCEVPASISDVELARRLKALGAGNSTSAPTITLHGRRFRLIASD
jgi:methionyl-tRNA formyltransferase